MEKSGLPDMLRQRVITAVVGLPIALAILFYAPHSVILIVFALFVGLGTYEVATMMTPRMEGIMASGLVDGPLAQRYPRWLVYVSIASAVLIFVASGQDSRVAGRGMVLFGTLGSMLVACFFSPNNNLAVGRVLVVLLSITYGAFPWLAAWDLYLMEESAAGLMFLIAVVFSGDTGAYFGGKRFGRNKIAPRMSPNKTVEGALFGLLASVVGGFIINLLYGGVIGSFPVVLVATILGGMFAQMGDLVESTLKRFAGIKDSGVIFPGHGGFLDRVDGVLFAAPVIWLVLYVARWH